MRPPDTAHHSRRGLAASMGAAVIAVVLASMPVRALAAPPRPGCNAAPEGVQSTYGATGLTSLSREVPKVNEPAPLPRLWLNVGITLLRNPPLHFAEGNLRVTTLPATWLWLEGTFGYGLTSQSELDARAGMWADGRAGVRLWRKAGRAPWRFVLAACRGSNYIPGAWEGTGLPEAGGGMGAMPERTRLDYVFVDVPVEHALWLDGGVRWGALSHCAGGCDDIAADPSQRFVRTWAAGPRYTRFTSARLDGSPLRALFEAYAYVLFRPTGLPEGPVEVRGPLLPDRTVSDRKAAVGFEAGIRYTPWAFEWSQIELAVGYSPAASDLVLQAGFSFPIWLL